MYIKLSYAIFGCKADKHAQDPAQSSLLYLPAAQGANDKYSKGAHAESKAF